MTEDDWLWSSNPEPMLRYIDGKVSERKLRLFAIACCRRYPEEEAAEPDYAKLLDGAEQIADGIRETEHDARWIAVYEQQLNARRESDYALACLHAAFTGRNRHFFKKGKDETGAVMDWVRECSRLLIERPRHEESRSNRYFRESERMEQAEVLREIVENPFKKLVLESAWRTSNVLDVARTIYERKSFDQLPILADALQDAGCDSEELLNHLRAEIGHFRGCWALDLVLEK